MKTSQEVMQLALVDLRRFCDDTPAFELGQIATFLNDLAINAARRAAYLETRHGNGCGDQGHDDAVKEQNRTARKVRKALGYTYPGHDINF